MAVYVGFRSLLADDRSAKDYLAEGSHFAKGSMAPKIQAIVGYLERGGTEALVTNPENVERALAGETGTRFTRD